MKKYLMLMVFVLNISIHWPTFASESAQDSLEYLQTQWAIDNYNLTGDAQKKAFNKLIEQADSIIALHPDQASLYIWRGIIQSTYAGVKGGLGGLKYAKLAKADLEKALSIDNQALEGSAYTSLGTLYFKVPSWPLGFGDKDQAQELLTKALSLNPQGIDPNYFYADFLIQEKRFDEARQYLQTALKAKPRPGRALADKGRRAEITKMLNTLALHND